MDTQAQGAKQQIAKITNKTGINTPNQDKAMQRRIRGIFFLVAVTTEGLTRVADLLDSGRLVTHVGEVLPLL
jgi:hypothetical protein